MAELLGDNFPKHSKQRDVLVINKVGQCLHCITRSLLKFGCRAPK